MFQCVRWIYNFSPFRQLHQHTRQTSNIDTCVPLMSLYFPDFLINTVSNITKQTRRAKFLYDFIVHHMKVSV